MNNVPTPISRVLRILRNGYFWVAVAMFAVGAIFHYPDQMLVSPILSWLGLTRHAMDRILFLVPITYVGVIFGLKAGLASVATALVIMLPRVFLISLHPRDALLETCAVIIVAGLLNVWLERGRR